MSRLALLSAVGLVVSGVALAGGPDMVGVEESICPINSGVVEATIFAAKLIKRLEAKIVDIKQRRLIGGLEKIRKKIVR